VLVATGALTGGALVLGSCSAPRRPGSARGTGRAGQTTVADWVSSRGPSYVIAHRGSGDVFPEHSLPGYQAALDWGAGCMELSVAMTSDGQLICLHDLTYDRTTTGSGPVAAQPASVLADIRLWAPQLGPAWTRDPLPQVPRLEQALDLLGHRTVLAMEAKDDNAYPGMLAMLTQRGLTRSVVIKAYRTSSRIGTAARRGLPVFAYLGVEDMRPSVIAELAGRLNPQRDYLGIPVTDPDGCFWPDRLIRDTVALGIPVWVYPAHRRHDADHYTALGVHGIVSSSYGYSIGRVPVAASDDWVAKAVRSGQISRDPAAAFGGPAWTGTDSLTLAVSGGPQLLLLGQLCPLPPDNPYRIEVEIRFDALPTDPGAGFCLATARPDDRYYQPGLASDGYDALLSVDGRLRLVRRDLAAGSTELGRVRLAPLRAGDRVRVSLQVGAAFLRLIAQTGDGRIVEVRALDTTHRGGYFHLGRTGGDGSLSLSGLSVSALALPD